MGQMPLVVDAQYKGAFKIHVAFDDGTEKTLDFRPWLKGPVFKPLKNEAYFRRFILDGWTVAWPNGADVDPETLYAAPPVKEPVKRARKTARREGRTRK